MNAAGFAAVGAGVSAQTRSSESTAVGSMSVWLEQGQTTFVSVPITVVDWLAALSVEGGRDVVGS